MSRMAGQSRRVRVAILGTSPCDRCTAECCRQNASEYAVLLADDAERSRFAAFSSWLRVKDDAGGERFERVILYREGVCPFLGTDNRCTIYEDRPRACRRFECVRQFNERGVGDHGAFVARHAGVRGMLESL